jgi:hypothetical protein
MQLTVGAAARTVLRALHNGQRARFTNIFLTSGLYCSQAFSRLVHLRGMRAAGRL